MPATIAPDFCLSPTEALPANMAAAVEDRLASIIPRVTLRSKQQVRKSVALSEQQAREYIKHDGTACLNLADYLRYENWDNFEQWFRLSFPHLASLPYVQARLQPACMACLGSGRKQGVACPACNGTRFASAQPLDALNAAFDKVHNAYTASPFTKGSKVTLKHKDFHIFFKMAQAAGIANLEPDNHTVSRVAAMWEHGGNTRLLYYVANNTYYTVGSKYHLEQISTAEFAPIAQRWQAAVRGH